MKDMYHFMNIQSIKDTIEKMPSEYHIELARILIQDNHVNFDENQNGIFINLSLLSPSVVEKIVGFVDYVYAQERHISVDENEKNGLKDIYFKRE